MITLTLNEAPKTSRDCCCMYVGLGGRCRLVGWLDHSSLLVHIFLEVARRLRPKCSRICAGVNAFDGLTLSSS